MDADTATANAREQMGMKIKILLLLYVLAWCATVSRTTVTAAEERYHVLGCTFEVPVRLSKPQTLDQETIEYHYNDARNWMRIIFTRGSLKDPDAFRKFIESRFVYHKVHGTTRKVNGKVLIGQWDIWSNHASYIQTYWVPIDDSISFLVGFQYGLKKNSAFEERIISTCLKTIRKDLH